MSETHLSTDVQSGGVPRHFIWPVTLVLVTLALLWSGGVASAAPEDYSDYLNASLAGANETTPNESIATGRAVFAVAEGTLISTTVDYRLSVSDIVSVTDAHLHVGVEGVDGPVLIDLLDGQPLTPDNPVTGQFTVTVAESTTLLNGGMYVNVHTDAYPDGEIRGQAIAGTLPENRHALLLGANEVPAVTTDARGLTGFEIDESGMLSYTVDVAAISNVSAGHIHRGPAGENGPVIHDLGAGGLTPGNTLTGTIMLAPRDVVDLLTGYLYVNIHTTQNEDGEIRGQISGASLFQADLSGAQEVPAVDTPATGRAVLGLDANGEFLSYRILVDEIEDINGAHIHRAAAGTNGSVVHALFPPGTFDTDNPLAGGVTLSVDDVLDMLGGLFYVNVHTDAHDGGEIRGQVYPYAPRMYHHALLNGGEEVPPVETDALGLARMRLNPADGMLHYTVFGREIDEVTAAHIHLGAKGENGGVEFNLDGAGFGEDSPLGGAVSLAAANMVDLLTHFYYVNVHTNGHPDGEIRGQVGGPRTYHADLSGANEVPAALSPASGLGIMALSADATALSYHVNADNLQDISGAHIHRAAAGNNGPVVVNFMPPANFGPGAPISGTVNITHGLVFDLAREHLYVNVHTSDYPDGEVRGQVVPMETPARVLALLHGRQEVPAVMGPGAGLGRIFVDAHLDMLRYDLWVDAVEDITDAHIHRGEPGINGPVIFNLLRAGQTFSETLPVGSGVHLRAQDWVDLLSGRFYVNVHTDVNPGGEVRGQIAGPQVFTAALSGAEEVPPVETIASGLGVMALGADAHTLAYRVMVNDIDDINAAHIHRAPDGTNGDVVVNFMPPASFGPGAPISGTVEITRALAFDLARGGLYVNVHTTDNSGGEVRGQIYPMHPGRHYMAPLTGGAEVPAVDTNGVGVAWLRLDGHSGYLHHGAAVRDLTDIQAAHIHVGPSGQNGPVDIGLFDAAEGSFNAETPISGGNWLTPTGLVDLLTGYYYVNVHTTANAGGEIRGQVGGARLWSSELAGANEVPPVTTDALGRVVAGLEADVRNFTLRAMVTGLPQTQAAHIHRGAVGENGGVIFNLLENDAELDNTSPLRYTTAFTLGQALDLIAGSYYVNVHTADNSGGEVRGQLMPTTPPTHLHAGLTGGAEVPAVTTDAAGIARFRVHPLLSALSFRLDVADITDVSMAHIHRGPAGENGPVFVNFDLVAGELDDEMPVAGIRHLSGGDWVDILTGNAYVNVHTDANAGGEVRGQVMAATPFVADLAGENEVPALTTDASGMAVVALSGDTATLDYRVTVEDITDVTAAHIHTGAAGVNGPVVRDLNGATLAVGTPITGVLAADNNLIFDVLRGRNYVNVHTNANSDGEVRGQLGPADPQTSYTVALTPGEEVAPASATQTEASGEAILSLDPVAGVLLYTVRVINLENIVAAHIHRGAFGENGPVVHTLYEGEGVFDAENPIADMIQLDSRDMVDLLSDFFYINVHTTEQPSGAIRGQVGVEQTEPSEPGLFVPRVDRGTGGN